ncbi:MAG: DNA polymerase III subunit alpha, partial [Acidobacteria bacterium]|nr:DNA polymerase III subunit alpha [Acidobacteriota bacterium]
THVDPVKYNLYFERFLNPERKNLPDIDLDFSSADRDFLIDKVMNFYGEDYCSMISTHNTFSARSAFREIAKAFSIPEEEISEVARALPHSSFDKLEKAIKLKPEAKRINFKEPPWADVLKAAKDVDGFPRHLSVHCGGIVISPFPLSKTTALERSAKGIPITQFDMFDVEDLGLVKIDLLGNRSLALLTEAVATIKEEKGETPPISPPEKTFEDKKTVDMISSGKTMGCFYIESPAMRQLLQRLNTRTFEELTAASSIIRPGVAESGMMETFIKRARGEEETKYLHPKLKNILSETYGVMVYQEDVLRVVNEFIGLSLSEGDLIRRAMSGKYRCVAEMEKLNRKFFEKGREKGISEAVLSELWEQIRSFAGYAFCKAHSASFAQLSFQCAYLKAHYKAHFFSALINNCGGFYPTSAYIEEARRCGLQILPPDVNLSEDSFRGKGNELRCGFFTLKGVRSHLIERLYEERGEGPFISFSDLLLRLSGSFSLKEMEKLILSGALDSFASNRGELLYLLNLSEGDGRKIREIEKKGALFSSYPKRVLPSLNEALKLAHFAKKNFSRNRPLSLSELLEGERFSLGFCVTAHPLTPLLP